MTRNVTEIVKRTKSYSVSTLVRHTSEKSDRRRGIVIRKFRKGTRKNKKGYLKTTEKIVFEQLQKQPYYNLCIHSTLSRLQTYYDLGKVLFPYKINNSLKLTKSHKIFTHFKRSISTTIVKNNSNKEPSKKRRQR